MEEFKRNMYITNLIGSGLELKDILITLRDRKFICPNCLKSYEPKHNSKEEAFMTQDMEAREQWLSHLCSDKCWDEYLGVSK